MLFPCDQPLQPLGLVSRLAGLGQRLSKGLPSQCAVCHQWPSQPVCAPCLDRLGRHALRCPGCAIEWTPLPGGPATCPDCRRKPLPLDACLAAVSYGYPWSGLLQRLKFNRETGWRRFFSELLLASPGVQALLAELNEDDWLLPLPLSAERLAERGFNQSWELAQALHRHGRCASGLSAQLLLRLRHTTPQSELQREARLANVQGAFAVDPLQAHRVRGKSVVLVDDVMTSGATLSAAAQALRAAGARRVSAIVVARTPA